MSGVRWDMLANSPNIAESVMRGFDDGMKRRAILETRRAMAALQGGPNPEAMRTLYTYNPQLAMQVEDQMYQREERQRAGESRNALADILLSGGGTQGGGPMRQPTRRNDPQQRAAGGGTDQQQELTSYIGSVAQWADTPEKWDQAVDYLTQNGLPNAARFKGQFSPELRGQLMAQGGIDGGSPESQQGPQMRGDYERAIRADPGAFLTFQGKRLDLTKKQFGQYRDLNNMGMQLLGGVHDQATYDAAKQRALQLYSSFGHDASEFIGGLPPQYSPETIKMLRLQGMDTAKQLAAIARENNIESQIEVREQRADEYERHNRAIESNVRRGQDRRPGGRGTKAPTPSAVIGRIMDKQARGERLSGAERQVLEEYRAGRGGKRSSGDLIGQVYSKGGKRIQYSKSKGGYVDLATGEPVK